MLIEYLFIQSKHLKINTVFFYLVVDLSLKLFDNLLPANSLQMFKDKKTKKAKAKLDSDAVFYLLIYLHYEN